jgi:ribosome maturation factor RimP
MFSLDGPRNKHASTLATIDSPHFTGSEKWACGPIFYDGDARAGSNHETMPTTLEKEHQLQDEIAPRVEHDLPGVDVLAVELLTPSRFRVYVDHPGGVDHGLCGRVTDVLRDYLREYSVEVSSPGPDRPLRTPEHFAGVVGRRVRLRTPGKKQLRGEVVSAGDQTVTVAASDGAETEIPYDEIVRANLIDEGA